MQLCVAKNPTVFEGVVDTCAVVHSVKPVSVATAEGMSLFRVRNKRRHSPWCGDIGK